MFALSIPLLPVAAITTLVAGEACVIGGPVWRVSAGERCCGLVDGNWFSKYPNQGICVFAENDQPEYESCVAHVAPNYDLVCIECDETDDCGLDPID